jgi:DNA-binding MarR family transcriptional regulator
MVTDARLANEAWEALFRAQVLLVRSFSVEGVWTEVSSNEYDVLYTVSKAPQGLTMVEINRGILMTQTGLSRLVANLVRRGLLHRERDEKDARAVRLTLTDAGREVQRSVGRRHAAAVAATMSEVLAPDKLVLLRELGNEVIRAIDPTLIRESEPEKQPISD